MEELTEAIEKVEEHTTNDNEAETVVPEIPPPPTLPRLGKRAVVRDTRTLKLTDYLRSAVTSAEPPVEGSWVTHVKTWGMMLNDILGDCTCAAAGHMIAQWSQYAQGTETVIPDDAVLKAYEAVSGYQPGDDATDTGAAMLDVLRYWRKHGIGGHKIQSFVSVDPRNIKEVKTSVSLFGNLYIGIQLPASAQGKDSWTVPDGGPYRDGSPGTWGGHCVPVVAYSPQTLTVVTWGKTLKMSWNFFHDYVDEAYCVLSPDWVSGGISPSKFDMQQLQADLVALIAL